MTWLFKEHEIRVTETDEDGGRVRERVVKRSAQALNFKGMSRKLFKKLPEIFWLLFFGNIQF
jgi:hypothetical protein